MSTKIRLHQGRLVKAQFPKIGVLVWIIFAATLGLAVWRTWLPAAYPDEMWFVQFADLQRKNAHYLFAPNTDGYGSLWWTLVSIVTAITKPTFHNLGNEFFLTQPYGSAHTAIFVTRLFSAAALWGALGFIIARTKSTVSRALLVLFFALPVAWWAGKWAAPDLWAVATAALAGFALVRKRPVEMLFWIGIAVGLRVTNLILLSGFILIALGLAWQKRSALKRLVLVPIALGAGFLVANPYFITHPIAATNNARGVAPPTTPLSHHQELELIRQLLSQSVRQWDTATGGSAIYWFGSPLVIAALALLMVHKRQWQLVAASGFGAAALTGVALTRGLAYGWYFMPLAAIVYIAATGEIDWPAIKNRLPQVSVGLLTVGLVLAATTSFAAFSSQVVRAHMVTREAAQSQCITRALSGAKTVYSLADPIFVDPGLETRYGALPMHTAILNIDHIDLATLNVVTTQQMMDELTWVKLLTSHAPHQVWCGSYLVART